MDVVDAKPCVKCGVATLGRLEIARDDAVLREVVMCAPCRGPLVEAADMLRKEFESLLACGASRETANEMMIERLRFRSV
jgi:hypothetical protein